MTNFLKKIFLFNLKSVGFEIALVLSTFYLEAQQRYLARLAQTDFVQTLTLTYSQPGGNQTRITFLIRVPCWCNANIKIEQRIKQDTI